jgi:hypothetical protein
MDLGNGTGYDTSYGFNGTIGWKTDLDSHGVSFRQLSGTILAAAIREADFYSEINLQQLYSAMRLKGNKRIANRHSSNSLEKYLLDIQKSG